MVEKLDMNKTEQIEQPASEMEQAFLGVTSSLMGKRWSSKDVNERMVMMYCQRYNLPEPAARLMVARGIMMEEADHFLNPTLKDLMPDPSRFKDMDKAADRIADAILASEKVAIFGDYDVDGATSSSQLIRYLRHLGQSPMLYIPDRVAEGYGPNGPALQKLAAQGVKVVIMVDCGTTAFEALEIGKEAGLEIIVLDHHTAEPRLPDCYALVNPNRLDEDGQYGYLAACGVTFMALVALNRVLRQKGMAPTKLPDLKNFLDIVALGTVCDVVPLVGLNRALTAQGLKVLGQRRNTGLRVLSDVSGIDEKPNTYHAGYVLGPRINAGGRVGNSEYGAQLLSTDHEETARQLSIQLDQFNTERKEMEAEIQEQALAQLEALGDVDYAKHVVIAHGEGWHPGVIGIVAARIKEQYNRPSCVIAFDENGIGKASARSVKGVDIGAAIISARQAGILVAGGGHAMAAGFTIERSRLQEFWQFLSDRISAQLGGAPLVPTLRLDGVMSVLSANVGFLSALDKIGPFGAGNPSPKFVVRDCMVVQSSVVGKNHVRAILQGATGGRLGSIAFNSLETELGQALLNHNGRILHIAGQIKSNNWQGRRDVQLIIDDAVFA